MLRAYAVLHIVSSNKVAGIWQTNTGHQVPVDQKAKKGKRLHFCVFGNVFRAFDFSQRRIQDRGQPGCFIPAHRQRSINMRRVGSHAHQLLQRLWVWFSIVIHHPYPFRPVLKGELHACGKSACSSGVLVKRDQGGLW